MNQDPASPPQQYPSPPAYQQPPTPYGAAAPSPAPPTAQGADKLKIFGIVLAVCAGILLLTLFTHGWASATEGRDSAHAGLIDIEGCGRGGRCETLDWDKAVKRLDMPSEINVLRILGLLGGLAAVGMMGFAAAQALSRKPNKIPFKATEIAMSIAATSLTLFVVRLMLADKDISFGPSWGAVLGIGSLIAASVVLRAKLRPLATT